jgi:hypothetical protein
MRRVTRFPSSLGVALALGMLIQTAAAPAALLAKVPDVPVTVTPVPNNATTTANAFVTAGDFVAFDVALTNDSPSTVAQLTMDATLAGPQPTYRGTFIVGGSLAAQTSCSASGAFACTVGNVASGGDLQLRVVYLTSTTTGTLDAEFFGTSTGAPGSDPGTSHGDTFQASAAVDTLAPFSDTGDKGTSGYVPPSGDDLQTNPAGFGPQNPMWTRITVPAAALANAQFGTTAFLQEASSFDGVVCPLDACFGQTSNLALAGGAHLPAPFKVEVRVDNAKKSTNLQRWTLVHILDDKTSYEIVDTECAMVGGVPTNAPCLESKGVAPDDKSDYVAVLWLLENGYIRNG